MFAQLRTFRSWRAAQLIDRDLDFRRSGETKSLPVIEQRDVEMIDQRLDRCAFAAAISRITFDDVRRIALHCRSGRVSKHLADQLAAQRAGPPDCADKLPRPVRRKTAQILPYRAHSATPAQARARPARPSDPTKTAWFLPFPKLLKAPAKGSR